MKYSDDRVVQNTPESSVLMQMGSRWSSHLRASGCSDSDVKLSVLMFEVGLVRVVGRSQGGGR